MSARLVMLIASLGGLSASARGSVTVDAGYTLLRNRVLLAGAYSFPPGLFAGVAVEAMYFPSVDPSSRPDLPGYSASNALEGEVVARAGYTLAVHETVGLSLSVYAGAWFSASRESMVAPSYGIDARDDRTLAAFRAGLRLEVRWFIFHGLGVGVGATVPWQLFRFSALGVVESSGLFGVSVGITWRIDLNPAVANPPP